MRITPLHGLAFVICGLLSIAPVASAQTRCDATQFDELTDFWKREPDQNTRGLPAAELAAERRVMERVLGMFTSAHVPHGAAAYYGVDYQILPHARVNGARYGNTYSFALSNHRIYCRDGKPVALDVSMGSVGIHVNTQLVGEASDGDSSVGFSYLPRGYYTIDGRLTLPAPNADGIHEFHFGGGSSTVWWLTRSGALPFRLVTQREFLQKQIALQRTAGRQAGVAHYQRMLDAAGDDVAVVKWDGKALQGAGAHAFTTMHDKEHRVYVTVNEAYYDRTLPKSAPQHIHIRLKNPEKPVVADMSPAAVQRQIDTMRKVRQIIRDNLPELRAMVKG